MKRIEKTFAELKRKGEKALVAYITAGYPDLETTRALICALEKAGVDIVEVGVPFSDPTADGPVIQAASQAALESGTTLPRVLDLIGELRGTVEIPLVLFSYYNPIFSMGSAPFARRAADCRCRRRPRGGPPRRGGGGAAQSRRIRRASISSHWWRPRRVATGSGRS